MSTSTTVRDAVVEAAAPAIEEVLDGRAGRLVRSLAQDVVLYFRAQGFVPTTTLIRTGLGVLLLIKVRNYPMAAYLVVPVYLLWETVGFSIVEGLWRRFSPQIVEQAESYYNIATVWLEYRWQRMQRAQRGVQWLQSNWRLTCGSVVATALFSWIIRRFYRWRNSPKTRFRSYSRTFFRSEAARQLDDYQRRGQPTKVTWLPYRWRLRWTRIRIDRLVPRVVDEFGCSKAFIRRLLLDVLSCDSNPHLQDWLNQHRNTDGDESLQMWIERGIGRNPPAKVREKDFLAIADKLRVYQSIYRQESLCTPFQLVFTLPSLTLFGTDSASHADKCGQFHMRVRYGFQNETGENALADAINWRLDAAPLDESAKGQWRENVLSSTSKRLKVRRLVSKWQTLSKGRKYRPQECSPSTAEDTVLQNDNAAAVDEEGWFNPLVYDGGARLSPRLKNLHGEELARMPPLRVQERKWEKRFVANGTAGSESTDAGVSSSEQQQHELRRFMLTGFMPTCRPAGMILPAGVREMCGQSYVEVEVAPAVDADGTPIAWSEAAWPEPAKHRTRLEAWHRKWGSRWASPRDAVGRGLGPGGGESALAMYYEVPDTNDISELLMYKMVKAGFSTMLRAAPELQYKITRELSSRLDVNIPLVQNFLRMLCKRTVQGQILPWLAMQQSLAGYIASRSGSPEEREAMLRAAMRWMIRWIAPHTERVGHMHDHYARWDDGRDVLSRQTQEASTFDQRTPEAVSATTARISTTTTARPTPDTAHASVKSATKDTASFADVERSAVDTPQQSTEMSVLGDRHKVCLERKRPEFLAIRIFYRGRRAEHTQENLNSDQWTTVPPQTAMPSPPPVSVVHTAPPGRRKQHTTSVQTPRSVPLKRQPPGTGFRGRLWWAAGVADEQHEDEEGLETEDYEECNDVYYLGAGGEDEAKAFVQSLQEAGEFSQPGNVVTHIVKWPRTAVICDVPPETEFTVEVYVRPSCLAGTFSTVQGDRDPAENNYLRSAMGASASLKLRWTLLSAAYESELEDLVLGDFDLSILPQSASDLDWEDHAVRDAATVLGLAANGEDWRHQFGSYGAVEPSSVGASADEGFVRYTPRDQSDSCKVGIEGAVWGNLSSEEKDAAKILGWREQADDRSWVEGATHTLCTSQRHDQGSPYSPHTPTRTSTTETAAACNNSHDNIVANQLCFGKRRAINSPDRAGLIAAGAADTTVRLRLDVSEEAAHEPNWLLIHVDVGQGAQRSIEPTAGRDGAQIQPLSHTAVGSARMHIAEPPALGDMLAVLSGAAPKRVEEELRAWVVHTYRDLAAQGKAGRDARWGDRAPDEAQTAFTAETQTAQRARVTSLLDSGANFDEFTEVSLGELILAAAMKLAEEEQEAAAQWAQRSLITAICQLYRARMTTPVNASEGDLGEVATADAAAAAAAAATEAACVNELLLQTPGTSEEQLLQRDLGTVVSIALRGIAAREIAPYISAARRVAAVMGVAALVIPAMFAVLVALATKMLVVRELEAWDSARLT